MADLAFVILTIVFFALTTAYIVGCERIEDKRGN